MQSKEEITKERLLAKIINEPEQRMLVYAISDIVTPREALKAMDTYAQQQNAELREKIEGLRDQITSLHKQLATYHDVAETGECYHCGEDHKSSDCPEYN